MIIIIYKGTWMVKDGEDQHRLLGRNEELEKFRQKFKLRLTRKP